MAGIEQPLRVGLSRPMADALYLLDHEGTTAVRSDRDGLVLSCADPDGFARAVNGFKGPRWASQALRTLAMKVRLYREAHPFEAIR